MVSHTFTCNLCNEHYSTNAAKRVLGFEHGTLTQGALDKTACHICISCLQAIKDDLPNFKEWLKGSHDFKPSNVTDEEALSVLGEAVAPYETWQWDEDAITWAMEQNVFKHGKHAVNSYEKLITELQEIDGHTENFYKAWYEKVLDKIMKQPA